MSFCVLGVMGRSTGYRPKKAVREEVLFWRAELAKCDSSQWLRAGYIMQEITGLLGKSMGPGNGRIEPRACKWCGFYGHTKQWCTKRNRDEEAAIDRLLQEDKDLGIHNTETVILKPYDPYDSAQARTFKQLGLPFKVDPDLGAILA